MNVTKRRLSWHHRLGALFVSMSIMNTVSADGVVNAVFIIDSDYFTTALPIATRIETEKAVAESLANSAKSQYGFLDWQAGADLATPGPKLILRMIDVGGGSCTPAIKLKWSTVLNIAENPLTNVSQHELYSACHPDMATQDPKRLVQEISDAVTSMLKNDATRQQISANLLKRVPIANELKNHNDDMLLLPVSSRRLLADRESKMSATFVFAKPGVLPAQSSIEFQPHESTVDDSVQLWILAIRVPSLPVPSLGAGEYWHKQLADILNGSATLDAKVFMLDYVPNQYAGQTVGDSDVVSDL